MSDSKSTESALRLIVSMLTNAYGNRMGLSHHDCRRLAAYGVRILRGEDPTTALILLNEGVDDSARDS